MSDIKRMADLLKSGAAMLPESCPVCGSPLFKFKGEVFCAKCEKPVAIIKGPEEETKLKIDQTLSFVEQNLLKKIWEANVAIEREEDPEKLSYLTRMIHDWLAILEKIRKMKGGGQTGR